MRFIEGVDGFRSTKRSRVIVEIIACWIVEKKTMGYAWPGRGHPFIDGIVIIALKDGIHNTRLRSGAETQTAGKIHREIIADCAIQENGVGAAGDMQGPALMGGFVPAYEAIGNSSRGIEYIQSGAYVRLVAAYNRVVDNNSGIVDIRASTNARGGIAQEDGVRYVG